MKTEEFIFGVMFFARMNGAVTKREVFSVGQRNYPLNPVLPLLRQKRCCDIIILHKDVTVRHKK
jgi:hypothetical protein